MISHRLMGRRHSLVAVVLYVAHPSRPSPFRTVYDPPSLFCDFTPPCTQAVCGLSPCGGEVGAPRAAHAGVGCRWCRACPGSAARGPSSPNPAQGARPDSYTCSGSSIGPCACARPRTHAHPLHDVASPPCPSPRRAHRRLDSHPAGRRCALQHDPGACAQLWPRCWGCKWTSRARQGQPLGHCRPCASRRSDAWCWKQGAGCERRPWLGASP